MNNLFEFSDRPSQTDELNSERVYVGLAELIGKAVKPFVLAVIGEWGSGKTTLIEHAISILEKNHFEIIRFNAWSHSKGIPLLKGLFTHLASIKGKVKDTTWKKISKRIDKLARSPIASATIRGLGSLGGIYGEALGKVAELLLQSKETTSGKQHETDNIEKLITDFSSIIKTIKEKENRDVLIFIDDIDRCNPAEALDLIDDIKVYLTIDAPVTFIVALDRRTLFMGIKAKYGIASEVTVDEYLQKIFSYIFLMPEYKELDVFIKNSISSVRELNEGCTAQLAKKILTECKVNNIRSIKRIVRRWAFLTPTDAKDFIQKTLSEDIEELSTKLEDISKFLLYACILFEVFPDYFKYFEDYATRSEKLYEELSHRNASPDSYFSFVANTSGEDRDLTQYAKVLKNRDERLLNVIAGLYKTLYLRHKDQRLLLQAYRQTIPNILHTVKLGLPL